MPQQTAQTARVVQATILQEAVISRPGATLEVRSIEIPQVVQVEITRGLQAGRIVRQEAKGSQD